MRRATWAALRVGMASADGKGRHLAVDAIERKPQRARADSVAVERMYEVPHQAAGDRDDRLLRGDRFEQIAQAVIDRRRDDEAQRLGGAAERLVDAREQFALEAGGERRARLAPSSAPTRLKPSRRSVAHVSRASRKASIGSGASAWVSSPEGQRDDVEAMVVRERPGRAGGRGDREPCRQSEKRKSMLEVGEQPLFAAEQMGGAGHVEEEAVRAVLGPRRDRGRIAGRPKGKTPQRRVVGGGIVGLRPAEPRPWRAHPPARRRT